MDQFNWSRSIFYLKGLVFEYYTVGFNVQSTVSATKSMIVFVVLTI